MKTSLLTPHRKAAAISVIAIMPHASRSGKPAEWPWTRPARPVCLSVGWNEMMV
jgi:hypothetical protein